MRGLITPYHYLCGQDSLGRPVHGDGQEHRQALHTAKSPRLLDLQLARQRHAPRASLGRLPAGEPRQDPQPGLPRLAGRAGEVALLADSEPVLARPQAVLSR
jgi:hypothetical protein